MVTGPGIPVGTVVTAVNSTTITLNQATTALNSGSTVNYAFGGANQFVVGDPTKLALGESQNSNAFGNCLINGIQGNVVTQTGGYGSTLDLVTPYSEYYNAFDSLGSGAVTVNGGTLDLGGASHTYGLI